MAFFVSALGPGLVALRCLRIPLSRLEAVCCGIVLGAAILSTITLGVASASFAERTCFLVIAGVGFITLAFQFNWWRGLSRTPLAIIPPFARWCFLAIYVGFGVLYFGQALSPDISPDGLIYHLGEVNLWANAHSYNRIIDLNSAQPNGLEILFLFAFTIGKHSAATLLNFELLMILPVLIVLFGIRRGWRSGAAVWASLLVFVTPDIGWTGSVPYNDLALTLTVFTSYFLLDTFKQTHNLAALSAASFVAGFSFAIKYHGAFWVLYFGAAAIWELRQEPIRTVLRRLALVLVVCGIPSTPYFVRNWIWYHDPIAFFGNAIFPNPYFHLSFEEGFVKNHGNLHQLKWSDLPLELTLDRPKMTNTLGPVYLLLPLALFGLWYAESRVLLFAGLFAVVGFILDKSSARYLLPGVPFWWLSATFALSCAGAFSERFFRIVVCVAGIVSWPSMIDRLRTPKYWHVKPAPLNVLLRIEPEETYLTRVSDPAAAAFVVNRFVPDHEEVFALGDGVAQSYTTHFILFSFHSARSEELLDTLYANENPTLRDHIWEACFAPTIASHVHIQQNGHSLNTMWSVNQIKFWAGSRRLYPKPTWRVVTNPNPFRSDLLLATSPAPRWRSWQMMRPGMSIDVDFGHAELVDRVEVISRDAQWESRMVASLIDVNRREIYQASAKWIWGSSRDGRREAMDALKGQGIHYVLIPDFAWHSAVFRSDPDAWGLMTVASTRHATLYRIR